MFVPLLYDDHYQLWQHTMWKVSMETKFLYTFSVEVV